MQKEELRAFLLAHDIPLHLWGRGEAKTLEHLTKELSEGEAALRYETGRLQRVARGAIVDVLYQDRSRLLRLRETRQVFADGRERIRKDLSTGIGEKLKLDETPLAGALRALQEELGIDEPLTYLELPERTKGPLPSVSYPGLYTLYVMYPFEVFLPRRLYRPEGYIERQEDKSNYFEWQSYTR
jgi:hypothetical protein